MDKKGALNAADRLADAIWEEINQSGICHHEIEDCLGLEPGELERILARRGKMTLSEAIGITVVASCDLLSLVRKVLVETIGGARPPLSLSDQGRPKPRGTQQAATLLRQETDVAEPADSTYGGPSKRPTLQDKKRLIHKLLDKLQIMAADLDRGIEVSDSELEAGLLSIARRWMRRSGLKGGGWGGVVPGALRRRWICGGVVPGALRLREAPKTHRRPGRFSQIPFARAPLPPCGRGGPRSPIGARLPRRASGATIAEVEPAAPLATLPWETPGGRKRHAVVRPRQGRTPFWASATSKGDRREDIFALRSLDCRALVCGPSARSAGIITYVHRHAPRKAGRPGAEAVVLGRL